MTGVVHTYGASRRAVAYLQRGDIVTMENLLIVE
jgi:hypothetical protein